MMTDPRRVLIDSLKEKNRTLELRAIAAEKEVIEKEFGTRIKNTRFDLEYISESIDESAGTDENQELYDQQQELSERLKFYQEVSMKLSKLIDSKEQTLDGLKEKGFPDMDVMIENRLVGSPQEATVTSVPVKNNLVNMMDRLDTAESSQNANLLIDDKKFMKDKDKNSQSNYSDSDEDLYSPATDGRTDSPRFPLNQKPGSIRKACRYFAKGKCKDGDRCPFLHNINEKRKTRICRNYQKGICRAGDQCDFAHGYTDLKDSAPFPRQPLMRMENRVPSTYRQGPHPEPCNNQQCDSRLSMLKYKTQRCRNPERCQNRESPAMCRYAHDEKELRALPKSEMCERWLRHLCKFDSDQCVYAHGNDELGRPMYSRR